MMSFTVAQEQAVAQEKVTTDHHLVIPPAVADSAKQAVQALGNKCQQGDFTYAYETMYPRYKKRQEALHGRDKLKTQFNNANNELLKLGVTIKSFTAEQPTGFFKVWPIIKPEVKARISRGEQTKTSSGDELYHWMVIVPTKQVWAFLSQRGGNTRYLQRTEFQIAVAQEAAVPGQEKWTFIASPIKEQQLRSMFPSLPHTLKLPSLQDKEIKQ